jgi:hypothetical protein
MDSLRKFSKKNNTKLLIGVILIVLLLIVVFKCCNNSNFEGFISNSSDPDVNEEEIAAGNVVAQPDCSHVELLNYDNRSINSIIINNSIRYGFFSNIDDIRYREIIVSLLDDPTNSQGDSSMNIIRLFEVSSLYNPIIVTPAEFKFVNNDIKYSTIKEGYDFNNILFVFKINNFVKGIRQEEYAVLFENKFFELRLIEINTQSSRKKFNLFLVNKFTASNIGFQIDSDIVNVELNKYYFSRISTTDVGSDGIKRVCLTLVEMDMNQRNNVYYKADGSFELSSIKDLNSESFNEEYQITPYNGILKCENTGIGRTIESLSKDSNTIGDTIANLNMDFAFVKIGGGKKIGISDMPPPPASTTTTTTQPPPTNIPSATASIPPAIYGYVYDFDDISDYLQNIINPQSQNNTDEEESQEGFTDIGKINNIEKYNNTLQPRDNFNNYLFESKEGFEEYTEGFTNCKIIDLTALKNYLTSKSLEHYTSFHNNRSNIQGMISLFHYQYVNKINENVIDFINQEIQSGRCESIVDSSTDSSNHCLISNYYMTESFNNMIKTFLKTYIESVFNTKIETVDENYEPQEIQNPFIDQLIMNNSTYKTEPFGMNDEINNFINELVNNYGLNLDFVVNIRYSNLPPKLIIMD